MLDRDSFTPSPPRPTSITASPKRKRGASTPHTPPSSSSPRSSTPQKQQQIHRRDASPRARVAHQLSELQIQSGDGGLKVGRLDWRRRPQQQQRPRQQQDETRPIDGDNDKAPTERERTDYKSILPAQDHEEVKDAKEEASDAGTQTKRVKVVPSGGPMAESPPEDSALLEPRPDDSAVLTAEPAYVPVAIRSSPPPTWQPHEITGHLAADPDDDGEGVNGIGFRPTPALAWARTERRKAQVQEYKSREAREARRLRSEKRRGHDGGGRDGGGGGGMAEGGAIGAEGQGRRVRFVEAGF